MKSAHAESLAGILEKYCNSPQEFESMLEENEENNKVLDQYEDFRRRGQDTLLLLKENLLKN